MTTILFFIAGWGLLILLLMLLPSIFDRKLTFILAVISGVIAMVAIASEQTLSWPIAVASGVVMTGAVSFIAAKRLTAMDDTLTLEDEDTVKHEKDQIEDGVDAEPPRIAESVTAVGTEDVEEPLSEAVFSDGETEDLKPEQEMTEFEEQSEVSVIDSYTDEDENVIDAGESEEADDGPTGRQFVITSEDDDKPEEAEDDGDLSSARLIQEDENDSVMERRPLNEDDGEPLMRRSSAMDAGEFAEKDAKRDEEFHRKETKETDTKTSPEGQDDAGLQDRRKRLFASLDDEG